MGACFRPRACLSALGLAALSLVASRALANPDGPIPSQCGTRDTFDAQLRERLGPSARVEDVQVTIAPRGERFHLRVQIGADVRELEDEDCVELLRAAVVVALAVLMRTEPAAAPPPPAVPPPAGPTYPRLTVAAAGGFTLGSLPKPVLALGLESKLMWQHFGVALDLRYLAPAEKRDENDKGVRLYGLGAGAAFFVRPAPRWDARLGFAAQRLTGVGTGRITVPQDDVSWTAGPTLGLGFTVFEARPFWLGLGAEGQLHVLRARFQIRNYSREISDQSKDIFVSPWLAASGFVRLGLLF
jgi:hypothetical protein